MDADRTRRAPSIARRLAAWPTLITLTGCAGAPAINVVGSYFPAWLLCTLIGLSVAVVVRQVFVLIGVEDSLVLPLVTHAAIALTVTLAVWLVWFGH